MAFPLRDAVTQADLVIAKPFATDTLLTEVNRSRWRAVNTAVIAARVTHPQRVIGQ